VCVCVWGGHQNINYWSAVCFSQQPMGGSQAASSSSLLHPRPPLLCGLEQGERLHQPPYPVLEDTLLTPPPQTPTPLTPQTGNKQDIRKNNNNNIQSPPPLSLISMSIAAQPLSLPAPLLLPLSLSEEEEGVISLLPRLHHCIERRRSEPAKRRVNGGRKEVRIKR